MRISLKWLSEYVDLGHLDGGAQKAPPNPPLAPARPPPAVPSLATAEELARRLTAVGLEVEAIERTGQGLGGVVAVRVLTSEKHPDAEKLSVATVDRGDGAPLQIVCGARNYRVGDLVPLATVGTTLPGGTKIEKATLRGVESFGMLCSARELGLAEDASGLLVLPPGVAPGTPIGQALGIEDVLFEEPLPVVGKDLPVGIERKRLRRRIPLARHITGRHRSFFDRPHRLTGLAIEDVHERLLRRLRQRLDRPAVHDDVGEDRRTRDVVIPDAVVHQLEVPLAHAGLQIDSDDALSKEPSARTMAAVVITCRRLDRQVGHVQLRVDRDLGPHASVAGVRP